MKTFRRLFIAVAALFAFACTTDVTEDLGVQLGANGQNEIVLSLEGTKTQLGEKAGDLYPLFWSEGDKISVNGVESTALSAEQAGSAVAKFSVAASAPYCIAYPAAPAGQVVFADKQAYVGNSTFASGVSTMYAYSADGLGVQMQHLTGVLKIGVVGSAKIVLAQISNVDRAPIAGAFEFDFEKGEIVKAAAGAKEVIEYSFGEGVELSSEPTYIHAAVPAGEYDELYVTLYDAEGGVMYATVKANETKPLTAGKIREFSNNIAYAANEQVFVVKDVASLKAFAEAATLEKDVLFVADVDMTGEEWTPIEGYAGTVRGNGYAIKGLTAPLFGTTNASFKGLHLRDVNINETVTPNVGALARRIDATAAVQPVVEHCSVSGKIIVNCVGYEYKAVAQYHEFTIGGLVGTLFGVAVDNCSSSAKIEVLSVVKADNEKEIRPSIGGVIGANESFTSGDIKHLSPVTNCSNSGDINIKIGSNTIMLMAGGVIGVAFKNNADALIENLYNSGNLTIDSNISKKETRIGGVVGWLYSNTFANAVNSGTVTYNSGEFYYMHMGGVIGYAASGATITDLHNKGAVVVKKEAKQLASLVVGGVVGYHQEGAGLFSSALNEGPVSVEGNMTETTATNYFRVAGVIGWSQCDMSDVTNKADINISGNLYNAHSNQHSIAIGGVVGYHTVKSGEKATNEGDITFTANVGHLAPDTDNLCRTWVGGIGGYVTVAYSDVENSATLSLAGSHNSLYAGGLFGNITSTLTNGVNSGDVTVEPNTTMAGFLLLGGCCGKFANAVTNIENSGTVTVGEGTTTGNNTYIVGGLAFSDSTNESTIKSIVNRGAVVVNGTFGENLIVASCLGTWNENAKQYFYDGNNYSPITVNATVNGAEAVIGGVASYMRGSGSRGLHNHKTGVINVNITTTTGKLAVGGIAYGLRHQLNKAAEGESANGNDADIFVTASTATTLDVAGLITTPNNYNRNYATNNGNITITGATVGTDLRVGGAECNHNYGKNTTGYTNTGNITIDATTKVQGSACIGGISGGDALAQYHDNPHNWSGCSNSGNITFSGEAGLSGTGSVKLGGMMASMSFSGTYDPIHKITNGFTNSGNVTYDGKLLSEAGNVYVGGIIGDLKLNTKSVDWSGLVVNTGTISLLGSYKGESYMGGIIGDTNRSFANCVSLCEMQAANAQNCGMIVGTMRSSDIIVSNCQVGGKIVGEMDEEDQTYKTIILAEDNYFNYIYGSGEATDWTGTDNYDGCTFLAEKPTFE